MADPAFYLKKAALLALVNERHCEDAAIIDHYGTDYPEMLELLFGLGSVFDCDSDYLDDVLNIWDDITDLEANGVYHNKSLVDQDDIRYLANTQISHESFLSPTYVPGVTLTNNSHVEHLQLLGTTLDYLIVADGSSIGKLTIGSSSHIKYILIKTCDPLHPSSIGEIDGLPDGYDELAFDDGSIFRGRVCTTSVYFP